MMGNIIFGTVDATSLVIDSRELSARLGGDCKSEAVRSVVDTEKVGVVSSSSPKYCAVRLACCASERAVVIAGKTVESLGLCKCLAGCDEVIIFAVTLGVGTDRYIMKRRALSQSAGFVADAVSSALAESLCEYAAGKVGEGLTLTNRFSVGYGDLCLSNQEWVLNILDAEKLLGITLTDSALMVPKKSITAIMGVKK